MDPIYMLCGSRLLYTIYMSLCLVFYETYWPCFGFGTIGVATADSDDHDGLAEHLAYTCCISPFVVVCLSLEPALSSEHCFL